MQQAETAFSTTDAAAIAAKNNRARLSIGREVEELLRIRREADEAAFRLIELLDLHERDPDLEDGGDDEQSLGWTAGEAAYGRGQNNAGEDAEPELGWTLGINQSGRAWLGRPHAGELWNAVPDGEAEHDGREPSLGSVAAHENRSQERWAAGDGRDLEEQCEDEGVDREGGEDSPDHAPDPAYYASLRARREAGKAVRP